MYYFLIYLLHLFQILIYIFLLNTSMAWWTVYTKNNNIFTKSITIRQRKRWTCIKSNTKTTIVIFIQHWQSTKKLQINNFLLQIQWQNCIASVFYKQYTNLLLFHDEKLFHLVLNNFYQTYSYFGIIKKVRPGATLLSCVVIRLIVLFDHPSDFHSKTW